ncbi:MAG TPA: CRISPR-associated protein Cas4 [Anaerolineales bacterium]|nr:CRISPR-associated protein Cas4 [Anaerolineales bacterium]
MLVLAFFLALLGFWFLIRSTRARRQAGLPGGKVIYTDTANWSQVSEPLYDPVLSLAGKPDYLVRNGEEVIPVEVKSSRVQDAPYDEHIYQLAAYCALVHRVYGRRPSHGIIHYPTRTFKVDYTPQLEAALVDVLKEMRQPVGGRGVDRSHESIARCRRCGFRSICDQRL